MRESDIEWLRPGEICRRNSYPAPQMFVGEIDRFDINQGEIGDCWFLAALANLADDEETFKRVVPGGQVIKFNTSQDVRHAALSNEMGQMYTMSYSRVLYYTHFGRDLVGTIAACFGFASSGSGLGWRWWWTTCCPPDMGS